MKVGWSKEALGDLRDIVRYIDFRNPQAAVRVKQRIMITSHQLREFPFSGMAVVRNDNRKLVVRGLPYILFYRVIDGEVKIISVVDARMERAPDLQ